MKAPGYIQLMSEYVETMRVLIPLVKDPDLKEHIKARHDELIRITIENINAEEIHAELHKAKNGPKLKEWHIALDAKQH